ncbi:abortive infection family protein [Streptomyces erythrochromogenes]|uniref:abortive infection family protein n=1 Tax=Streptomyces erythrochromogenes TaxID=285574 RepID=UPI00386F5615|nr:abortive infection family protein [Streptomyces erythrochromogenes]WSR88268.1 abortive infection family protein [Streptomyces erythrochromogenes]
MTVIARRDLVSPGTRNAFRSLATDLTVRTVAELWEGHGFAPVAPEDLKYSDPGQRRTEFMRYAEGVDWADDSHVRRALLVFEDYIRTYRDPDEEGTPRWLEDIKVRLGRDGYHLNDDGRISWINPPVLMRDLSGLNDPSGILVELERIRRDLTTDPQGAIGAAKQLIEATAKTTLRELGVVVEKNRDVPILVAMVHKELRLDAASAPDGPDGSKAIKKILSGVINIAVGVAELRNQGFGSGHGQASAPAGLGVRHARLTVNAAVTWCELILDTMTDPSAPWRNSRSGDGPTLPETRTPAP